MLDFIRPLSFRCAKLLTFTTFYLIIKLKGRKGSTMASSLLKKILHSPKTVFSFKELLLLSDDPSVTHLRGKIYYYIKKKDLHHVRRGIYAKTKDYDPKEVATKIFVPSYISFETVLRDEGMIFQFYSSVFVATYRSQTVDCDGHRYIFRTIKRSILTNNRGIIHNERYSIASPERAFLDMLYIHKDYHFDSLSSLDWEKVYDILPLYNNKRMERVIREHHDRLIKDYQGAS